MTIQITPTLDTGLLPATVDVIVRWLKAEPLIQAVYSARISTSLPKNDDDITYPWLTVGRVFGQPALPEAPIDQARIQFNSWGGVTASGAPYWPDADEGIRVVESLIRGRARVVVPGYGVIVGLTNLQGSQQLEDPDDGGARFWMDAIISARGE